MTSFLDRLLGRPQVEKRYAKAVTALGPWSTGVPISTLMHSPQDRARTYLKAYKVGWFYKAGRKIADDIASLDWSVSDGDVEEGEAETTLDRPPLSIPFDSLSPIEQFQRLLEAPLRAPDGRVLVTGRQLLRKTEVRLDFAGAAAWWLEGGNSGLPTAIYGISPARMWPSRDKSGNLIGWVMDKDGPSGGVPFDVNEILWFTTGNADDDDTWGSSVVEAVYSQVPLTELMARHTADVLTTGGRLAGMLWPKERALSEDEFQDAQRAWRNVASDPNAARRLLIYPEPMEYATGASTPKDIGIPELSALTRDEILTAFPVGPEMLGVPMPAGLNASGESRQQLRKFYWEDTIHPRADLLEEFIQVGLLSRYESKMGRTFDFEIAEPNLDDASTLLEKVAAVRALANAGFDEKESVKAAGLAHIKFAGIPAPDLTLSTTVSDTSGGDQSSTTANLSEEEEAPQTKGMKAREDVTAAGLPDITAFLRAQRTRVTDALRATLPAGKVARVLAVKADPEWWDSEREEQALREALRSLYVQSAIGSLTNVADSLDRIVPNKAVSRIVEDLFLHGAERIADINARTLQAITIELAEGTRRGYSIPQLIDGVPDEGFKGVFNVGLENGMGAWDDARAEMIARTETALSYNRAALDGYKEFNVSRVQAIDGDYDAECAARNGSILSIDEALGVTDHPNGTLDWIPITDGKSVAVLPGDDVDEAEVRAIIAEEIAALKAALAPPQLANQPIIQVLPAPVNVDVHVPEQPAAVINLPEQQAPQVTVNVPEQQPPIVNVKAEPKVIDRGSFKGSAPAVQDVRIVDSTVPSKRRRVKRDRDGLYSVEEDE